MNPLSDRPVEAASTGPGLSSGEPEFGLSWSPTEWRSSWLSPGGDVRLTASSPPSSNGEVKGDFGAGLLTSDVCRDSEVDQRDAWSPPLLSAESPLSTLAAGDGVWSDGPPVMVSGRCFSGASLRDVLSNGEPPLWVLRKETLFFAAPCLDSSSERSKSLILALLLPVLKALARFLLDPSCFRKSVRKLYDAGWSVLKCKTWLIFTCMYYTSNTWTTV